MAFTEHASKKYVDERDALLATKTALAAEAEERERLANIVAQNRRDTYSKDEVNRIVEALRGARFEKVQALPELADANPLVIYLLPRTSPETDNRYDEYIVVIDGEGARSWDKFGSTDIDLSGYATETYVQNIGESVKAYADNRFATKQAASEAYSEAQRGVIAAGNAMTAAQNARSAADNAASDAQNALNVANGKQNPLSPEQLANIAAVPDKLDKDNGVATGTIFVMSRTGTAVGAIKIESFNGFPSISFGTYNNETGVFTRSTQMLEPQAAIGSIVLTPTLESNIASAVKDKLGISNIYRLVGKTSGGADCNLVWYNMQTATLANVLGFTVNGVGKTVKSVYITGSPSFPDVEASVTDSNDVSYDFSGTAETLNLHEVATRGECAAKAAKKRDWTDDQVGTVVAEWKMRGSEDRPFIWRDAEGQWRNDNNNILRGPRFVEAYQQDGQTFYRDRMTGQAPVYSFWTYEGAELVNRGQAAAPNLDLYIAEAGVQFYVSARTDSDRFARASEIPDISGKRDKTDDLTLYGDQRYEYISLAFYGGAAGYDGDYYYHPEDGTWHKGLPHQAYIRKKDGTDDVFEMVVDNTYVVMTFTGLAAHQQVAFHWEHRDGWTLDDYCNIGVSAVNHLVRTCDLEKKVDKTALAGETLPEYPTQNQLAEAVKKIFDALGGTIQ